MPNYSLGPTNPICYPTVSVPRELVPLGPIRFYPNPAHNTFSVESSQAGLLELFNFTGKLISTFHLQTGKFSIDAQHLASGIYLYSFTGENGQRTAGKIEVIQ